jgi:adenosylhomocysteine nucleosidase
MRAYGRAGIVALVWVVLAAPGALAQSVVGVLGITREIAPIEQRLQDVREVAVKGYVFRVGTLNGRHVVVGRSGVGKVNAAIVATLLIHQFNPSAIVFSGTAGAIDPALQQGDVVIGATVAHHDVGQQTPEGIRRRGMRNAVTGELDPLLVPAPESLLAVARRSAQGLRLPPIRTAEGDDRTPRIVEGVIVTGDVFMSDNGRRAELREGLGATAVEMEGAAVVHTCRQFGVPCLVIRSITDRADGQAMINYEKFLATASENAATLAAAVIAGLDRPTEKYSNAESELRQLEQRLAAAWVSGDRAFIESLLADSWNVIDQAGRTLTRKQVLDEAFSSGDRRIEAMTIDEVTVRLFDGVAVVTGRTQATGNYRGQKASAVLRFTDVFQFRDGRWRIVASQGTTVLQ